MTSNVNGEKRQITDVSNELAFKTKNGLRLPQADIAALPVQLEDVRDKLDVIQKMLMQIVQTENKLGDWVDEDTAITISGLGKTRLYQLRREGKLTFSSLGGKAKFYRLSDLKNLLDANEKNQ